MRDIPGARSQADTSQPNIRVALKVIYTEDEKSNKH